MATVSQLNVSGGGVPKRPVPSVVVRPTTGIEGDVQAKRKHHGRPWQALCLWSREVIEALQAEGHPIQAGAAGENVTIEGLDWSTIRPGVVLRLGGDVVCEITAAATPCTNNAQWFLGRDYNRMDDDLNRGWSRMYAAVLTGGTIAEGDPVVVESADIDPSPLVTSAELNERWGGW